MSDTLSAIADDIEDYERGCKELKVSVRYTQCGARGLVPDCYSDHALWVSARISGEKFPEPPMEKGQSC